MLKILNATIAKSRSTADPANNRLLPNFSQRRTCCPACLSPRLDFTSEHRNSRPSLRRTKKEQGKQYGSKIQKTFYPLDHQLFVTLKFGKKETTLKSCDSISVNCFEGLKLLREICDI